MLFARTMLSTRRALSTKSLVTKPITQRMQEQTAQFWKPKESDPIEGFGLIGLLAGTMVICVLPGILAALEPKHSDEH